MNVIPSAVAAGLLLAAAPASAREPARDWISIGRVEALLRQQGYRLIEIEPKDDHWEGEATRGGTTWDFSMDPKTGRILSIERDTD